MAASTSEEDMDAIFQPRPHGAIAIDPLTTSPSDFAKDVNCLLQGSTTQQACARGQLMRRPRDPSNDQTGHGSAGNRAPVP